MNLPERIALILAITAHLLGTSALAMTAKELAGHMKREVDKIFDCCSYLYEVHTEDYSDYSDGT